MKAYIFTPGDLICRRGEVAREMFIIADGVVEIISETGVMLKRMGAGDFFGEIGILNLDGGINRRTADVRSVGYLELFVLSREDVLEALKDHPEAESIIRDYGQRRLREVEAHRQKVKPLKCRGSTDQQGSISSGPQTVQNRLLQTLRNLNQTVRRQSAQMNHLVSVSPPAAAQAGNGPPSGNNQRCVNQQSHKDSIASLRRDSPACKASSIPASATSPLAQGYAKPPAVPDDQTPADGGGGGKAGRAPSGRRHGFGYLRAACSRFRCVFYRRSSRRRFSADCGKQRGNSQVMSHSFEDRSGLSDHSNHSSPISQKCNIKLNIETCVDGSQSGENCHANSPEGADEENDVGTLKEVKDKSSLFGGVKRGSLLIQGYFEGDSGLFGPRLVKGNHRKCSEPIAYMPVCTEDLDEPETHPSADGTTDEGPNPAGSVKYCRYKDMDAPVVLTSSESLQPLELSTLFPALSTSPALSFTLDCKSGSFNEEPETLPDTATSIPEGDSLLVSSQCKSNHIEASETLPINPDSSSGTLSPGRTCLLAKHPIAPSVAKAVASKHSPARVRKLPSSNPRPLIQDAPQPPPGDDKEDLLRLPATPIPCLVNASPSPFSLLCQCDPRGQLHQADQQTPSSRPTVRGSFGTTPT
ncbi:hypothetical protein Btru_002029 [Bulinus truncatus]|nr:hypothetical protein Btru_002029 [Bulinus truncatus]